MDLRYLEMILDVLEEDEFLQVEFSVAVNGVSSENLFFLTEFAIEQVEKRVRSRYKLEATCHVPCASSIGQSFNSHTP